MSQPTAERLYREYVVDHELERRPLFEALLAHSPGIETVLYPGSLLHVTPSFVFQHVVYVDRSDLAARFFADKAGVEEIVATYGRHRRPPYIGFLQRDFCGSLPLPDGSFDLLLALYTVGVTRACSRYLKTGGLLLTDDHRDDADDADRDEHLTLVATGRTTRGAVSFEDVDRGSRQDGSVVRLGRRPRGARYFLYELRRTP